MGNLASDEKGNPDAVSMSLWLENSSGIVVKLSQQFGATTSTAELAERLTFCPLQRMSNRNKFPRKYPKEEVKEMPKEVVKEAPKEAVDTLGDQLNSITYPAVGIAIVAVVVAGIVIARKKSS